MIERQKLSLAPIGVEILEEIVTDSGIRSVQNNNRCAPENKKRLNDLKRF